MSNFYTDQQGRVRPIDGRRGGGRGGGRGGAGGGGGGGGAAVLVAALLVGAMAAGGGLPGASRAGDPAWRQQVANSKSAARKGQYDLAWRRMGWRAGAKTVRREVGCAARSYGQVRTFFTRTPCRYVRRSLLSLVDARGNTVVVSIAWVGMPDTGSAMRLRRLVDEDGTGNVSPIGSEALGLGGVRFTGEHYASRRPGSTVVIAEAAPGRGRPEARVLDAAADIAVEYPAP